MMKRLIATALAAAMIFGLVSVALAASFEDTEGYEFEASVLKLADLGVIKGYDDGTFKPESLVTRAEFATMIVRMLGLESAADSLKGQPVDFSDVDPSHWAVGYINVAYMMGIVQGYEDGTFRPAGNITYAEAIKMVLAAMGYSADGFPVHIWPASWIAKAVELEIDDGLTIVAGLAISRGEVAKLFDNALTKNHVYVKEGEFVERDPEVTFMNKLKVNYIDGQVVDTPELWSNTSGKVKIKGKDDEKSFAIDDFDGLFGHNVRVWYKGSKALGVEVLTTEKTVTASEYKKITEPKLIFINFTPAEYDEETLEYKGEAYNVANDSDEIVVVYDGSTAIAVKAIQYKVGKVTDIYAYGKRMDVYLKNDTLNENYTLKLYDFDVEYVGVNEFDDIKKGDILHYIYDSDNDKALIIVARDVVKGTLTEITYDNKIKVDGKAFSASTDIDDLKDEVGKVVTLYLDKDGKVFDYKVASTPDAVYGVVQAIASRVVDKKPRTFHKVLTLEGEVEYIFAGTGTGPDVGAVVKITLEDDEATYTVLKDEDKIEGKVKKRDTEKIIIVVDITEEGEEVTEDVYYTENTLWVEGKEGEYVERPLPYIDDEVTVYTDPEDDGKVAVGIIK